MTWRPGATWPTLEARARLLARARAFFAVRGILEVETPALVTHAVTDIHLANARVALAAAPGQALFLHTSPEYHMKRLLAAGAPDIYQLCKVFRDGEAGPRHEPEFTMAEWYRRGLTLDELITETCELIGELATEAGISLDPPVRYPYRQIFQDAVGADPLTANAAALQVRGRALLGDTLSRALEASMTGDTSAWLDLLMTHVVTPRLGRHDVAVIHSYPGCQAALARLDPREPGVAERFEVFCRGLEVANGYHELADAPEQARRFERDRAERLRLGRPDVSPDPQLLEAIRNGLPDCCGVAMGFDRVVMILLGLDNIQAAMSFPVLTPGTAT